MLSSPVSQTDSFLCTDILYNAHSDIPPPSRAGQVFSTTSNIWSTHHLSTYNPHPVLESNNRYSILPVEETNELSLDDWVVRAPPKLTKRPASSSLRVNAADKKTTIISSTTLMAESQSRPSLGRFQAAVTQTRPGGTELHARSLQSSVAEGRADSGKAGPQA